MPEREASPSSGSEFVPSESEDASSEDPDADSSSVSLTDDDDQQLSDSASMETDEGGQEAPKAQQGRKRGREANKSRQAAGAGGSSNPRGGKGGTGGNGGSRGGKGGKGANGGSRGGNGGGKSQARDGHGLSDTRAAAGSSKGGTKLAMWPADLAAPEGEQLLAAFGGSWGGTAILACWRWVPGSPPRLLMVRLDDGSERGAVVRAPGDPGAAGLPLEIPEEHQIVLGDLGGFNLGSAGRESLGRRAKLVIRGIGPLAAPIGGRAEWRFETSGFKAENQPMILAILGASAEIRSRARARLALNAGLGEHGWKEQEQGGLGNAAPLRQAPRDPAGYFKSLFREASRLVGASCGAAVAAHPQNPFRQVQATLQGLADAIQAQDSSADATSVAGTAMELIVAAVLAHKPALRYSTPAKGDPRYGAVCRFPGSARPAVWISRAPVGFNAHMSDDDRKAVANWFKFGQDTPERRDFIKILKDRMTRDDGFDILVRGA